MTALLRAGDEEAAAELLHSLGCTDGLPVIIPTAARVERMLAASPALDPDDVLGVVMSRQGIASVASVAVQCGHGRVCQGPPPARVRRRSGRV